MKKVFEEIFNWAERIEHKMCHAGNPLDILAASYDTEGQTSDFESRVFAIPEAVASMASYLFSLRKEEGLHAIIDLGAGTTDISICNLFIPFGESKSYWYASRNIPKGTVMIERLIASYINKVNIKSCCTGVDILGFLEGIKSEKRNVSDADIKYRQLTQNIYMVAPWQYVCRFYSITSPYILP